MRVRTARDEFPMAKRRGVMANAVVIASTLKHSVVASVVKGHEVYARVNHGRWLADCGDCNGAELVDPSEPVFMCLTCGNKAVGGCFRPVVLPNARAQREAMLYLEKREAVNQNWDPTVGEDIAFLAAENLVYLQQRRPTLRQADKADRARG